jgi:hypothetical protein
MKKYNFDKDDFIFLKSKIKAARKKGKYRDYMRFKNAYKILIKFYKDERG